MPDRTSGTVGDEGTARELDELRVIFSQIKGPGQQLELGDILTLPEIKAQIAEGDILVENLENAWLEACAIKGARAEDTAGDAGTTVAKNEAHGGQEHRPWGVCTELSFDGFVHFLDLCESRASMPKEFKASTMSAESGRNLVAARHHMLGLLRATLKLHQSGGAVTPTPEEGADTGLKEDDASLGDRLHSAMVRAALEQGLAHHTPETLRELMRRGVFRASSEEAKLEREEREALLSFHLSKKAPHGELISSGILVDKTPEELTSERQCAANSVKHGLENRRTPGELVQQGVLPDRSPRERQVERAFLASKLKHDLEHRTDIDQLQQKGIVLDVDPEQAREGQRRAAEQVQQCLQSRPTLEDVRASNILPRPDEANARLDGARGILEEMLHGCSDSGNDDSHDEDVLASRRLTLQHLEAQGIYLTPVQVEEIGKRQKLTKTLVEQGLCDRARLSELAARGIYRSPRTVAKQCLERSMLSDYLNKSLRARPHREDLMDRGMLEASGLKYAFQDMAKEGPVDSVDKVLQWPVLASAVEEGMVTMPGLEKAFADVMESNPGSKEVSEGTVAEGMSYEQFGAFLSAVETVQAENEPLSLKRWALAKMRPAMDEKQHHESNHRRNTLMATELQQGLSRREPLEQLANKGIYLETTPMETGVERAHLKHALANGLKHRSTLDELAQKGVYLKGVASGHLEQARRDARNALEGMLSIRPDLEDLPDLEEKGYLEVDDLEDTFYELLLSHKREKDDVSARGAESTEAQLPAECLASWAPVRAMVESGVAIEDDVMAALEKAKQAMPRPAEGSVGGSGLDFVGFLEFVHNLDLEVDGLDHGGGEEAADPEARERRRRRLERRRARAAQAASQDVEMAQRTLKGHLLAHLRSRPAKDDPETLRLAKGFRRSEAVELQKELVKNRLEGHLRSRVETSRALHEVPDGRRSEARLVDGEQAARVRELEFNLNKRMLMHRLARRSTGEELLHKGILHSQSARQEHLQRILASDSVKHALESRPSLDEVEQAGIYKGDGETLRADHEAAALKVAQRLESRPSPEDIAARGIFAVPGPGVVDCAAPGASAVREGAMGVDLGTGINVKREVIEDGLDRRPTLEDLKNRGVYQDTTPSRHKVDRDEVERRLEDSLGNARRPTKKELQDQGIYMKATPKELQMEHYLAARNVKRGLEGRGTIQDLKNHGIYLPGDTKQALHNKLLVKALLRKRLSHTFSPEELEQLKQKGIYKEEEHAKLKAERALVTQQLGRLMSSRPNPDELERQHPEVMEASTLALVFEERVTPPSMGNGAHGAPEHLVSFEALMTWPDVQEFVERGGGKCAELEIAQHFRLCDTDGDGFLTFSQFLRWVELCDLNPEDHVKVSDADLDAEYTRLLGAEDAGVSLDQAASSRLVQRWATSGRLGHDELEALWGHGDKRSEKKDSAVFKAFCRQCESRSAAAHEARRVDIQAKAVLEETAAKERLKSRLSAKLSARPDLEELEKARIYKTGGIDPATELLERNLIVNDLKQQLLSRPALEDLEMRGIKPREDYQIQLEKKAVMLAEALDVTMQHDDARWRSDPSQLGPGPRAEVSALLQTRLAKRAPLEELSNKGIYIVDSEANYALLVHKVLQAHLGFNKSSSELVASLEQ